MSKEGLPSFQPFDPKVDDFTSWFEKFESFVVANYVDSDDETSHSPESQQSQSSEGEADSLHSAEYSDNPASPSDDIPSSMNSSQDVPNPQVHRPGFYGTGSSTSTFSLHNMRKLTPTLKGMIGEAHLQFARGEHAMAVDLCMEVIKEMPTCAEPYHTLAMIYENDSTKALQYLFIAAFLQPKGFKDWTRIAQMSVECGNKVQAVMCFKKALSSDRKDASVYLKYGELLEDTDDKKGALKAYAKVLAEYPGDGYHCVISLRKSACIFHKMDEILKAHESLNSALTTYPSFITSSETNLMLDLCIEMKRYVEACRVLVNFEHVIFLPTLSETAFETRESLSSALQSGQHKCLTPINFAIDLLAKLITTLIHLEAFSIANTFLDSMTKYDVETYGDLYLDIAESYMAKKNYESALMFLLPLIQSQNFSQAAVWLRYAECLFLLVRLEEAVGAYQKVVELAPTHCLAKLNLAVILQKLGRADDALETLNQQPDEEFLDADLMMEKCQILYKKCHFIEFINTALALLSRHSIQILDKEDSLVVVMVSNFGKRYEAVLIDRLERDTRELDPEFKFFEKEPNVEREYRLYLRLCRLFVSLERWDLLAAVSYGCCASTVFAQVPALESECEFHSFLASILVQDDDVLPQHMRIVLGRRNSSTLVINVLSMALQSTDHARYTKHVTRLLERSPMDSRLLLLNAHIGFTTGTYKTALMEYITLLSQTPDDPLIPLMIAAVFLHVMAQKTTKSRVSLCLNLLAFLKRYMDIRGECQESYYNVGRFFHSLGYLELAIHYYQLVLQSEPPENDIDFVSELSFSEANPLDLKCEAAFNLAQIYNETGSHDLARSFLFKYIRI